MKLLLLSALLLNASVMAAEPTLLETPVVYAADASVVPKVKEECKIEGMLEKRIGEILAKANQGLGTIAQGTPVADGQVLRLKISHVLGVGGGAYSGPKAITVYAELLQNGKVARETKLNRWSMGGVFGGFSGTCSILDRCAVAIGKDLAQWVKDPSYIIKDQPAPKTEAAPAPEEVKS
ncbi:hypothetical protein [Chitinibacter sp. S2-10]|uniref:hypothetical protein n=1 Tax=Chitinibacter sp. S2-10 TaxID=3373597 RepID=UPI003977BBE3